MCAVQTIQQGNLLFVRLAPLQQSRRHLETEAGVDNAIKSGLKGNGDDGWEWTIMHYVWCLVFSILGFAGYSRGRPSRFCKDYKMHMNSDSQGRMHSSYNTKNA